MMRIGLYGIYGVYNFGCEAIIRGAYKLIKNLYFDADIIYFSYNYEFDRNALKDIDIDIRPVITNKKFRDRVNNKMCALMNLEKRVLFFDYAQIINSVDMIFSIGGDIYTIPEVLRNNNAYPYYNSLVDFCDRAIVAGKEVVVYGASVGPFGNYQKAVDYYKRNLDKYKMIICREQISIEYLKNLGLENVCFFPDPALQVKCEDTKNVEPRYIGINLSPLSVHEIYGDYGVDNCRRLAKLLDDIYEATKKELLFIPHVLSKYEGDNDLEFMKRLLDLMKPQNQQYVKFADSQGGFLGLKPQLKQCYIVVSARMHCAINAIVENIPALFLSYSQKSIGMCEYIYGSRDWLVSLNDMEKDVISKINLMLNNREKLVEYLIKQNQEMENFYLENLSMIKQIF